MRDVIQTVPMLAFSLTVAVFSPRMRLNVLRSSVSSVTLSVVVTVACLSLLVISASCSNAVQCSVVHNSRHAAVMMVAVAAAAVAAADRVLVSV
jgi:hypothetical protein